MRKTCPKIILFSLLGIFFVLSQTCPLFAALITDVRFWSAPDNTRVVLDLTGPVQYESFTRGDPPQCHLEIRETNLFTKKREIVVNDPFLSKINLNPIEKGRAKLILYQKKPLKVDIFPLKPYLDKPHRLVIDLIDVTQEKKEEEERKRQREIRPTGTKIVVIDPGHGGEDPGAIGPRKTREKDVVLKIGLKLAHFLNHGNDVKAFLTRKGDYFLPLEERMRIAREYGADLFVSLHADGSFNPHARGSSIYCLSLSGATDEAAKILADKENMSNILGGALLRPVAMAQDPHLNQILLDLMQNNSMRESFRFAEIFLENMKSVNHLKYPYPRQANFIVLKAPDIPSALIEIAFITNREDERLLNQPAFQEKIARSMTTAVLRYFKQ